MADTIDNTHSGFASRHADSKGGKTLWQKFRLCFHHQIFVPVAYVIGFVYVYYVLFTDPSIPPEDVRFLFIVTIVGHASVFLLLKMTTWDKTVQTLKEIFG